MRTPVVLVIAALCAACSVDTPTSPAIPGPRGGVPASLQFSAGPGTGATGGTAILTATVMDGLFAPVADVPVTFSAAAGTLQAAIVKTDAKGLATTILVADAGTVKVTAAIDGLQPRSASVAVQPAPTVVAPPVVTPGPSPTPAPEPGPLTVVINVAAGQVGEATSFGLATRALQSAVWTFGDGSSATTAGATTHVYTAAGTYAVAVVVTDTLARTASATSSVTIVAPAVPPASLPAYSVTVVASPAAVTIGGTATLTATVNPQNGAPAATSFAWDCDGNGTVDFTTALTVQACTYPTAGAIVSRVAVTGGTASGVGSVTVTAAAPVITISCSTGVHAAPPGVSTCVASATVGGVALPSGRFTSVTWDFGDGIIANAAPGNISPGHTYGVAATFTVFGTATISGVAGTFNASTTTTILP